MSSPVAAAAKQAPARQEAGRSDAQAAPVPQPVFAPPVLIQRKCACGGSCPNCEEEKKKPVLQTKLQVNTPGDVFEQEADRVADQVVAMRRAPAHSGTAPPGTTPVTPGIQSRIDGLRGRGQSLPSPLRGFFESRIGHDFSQVRIHADSEAAQSAREVNALAFTVGQDLVFGAGQYAPHTPAGQHLLAHELTHVVQQRSGATGMLQRVAGPCEDIATPHVLVIRGSVHPAVREAQRKLNIFHQQQIAAGKEGLPDAPLVDDCIFGQHTFNAVLAFQQQVFPDHPEFQTGNIGDHTWAELDKVSATVRTPTPTLDRPPFIPAQPGDLADFSARVTNVKLTTEPAPDVIGLPLSAGTYRERPNWIKATGSADVLGDSECDHFFFGFFQICRPFSTVRWMTHSITSNSDAIRDMSDALNSQLPLPDVSGNPFTGAGSTGWSSEIDTPNCAPGVDFSQVTADFQDRPAAIFQYQPDEFLSGVKWEKFYLTAFSVLFPDGSVKHLKSFYWDIRRCVTFDPPKPGEQIGNPTVTRSEVNIGDIMDHAPQELVEVANASMTKTCNVVSNTTPVPSPHIGNLTFDCK